MEPLTEMAQPGFLDLYLIPWTLRILVAAAIFIIGKWLAARVAGLARGAMERGGMDTMLSDFLAKILHAVLLAVVGIAALDHLGVQTTSLLAVLGAAGLSGVMLIIFRPFKVGDFIEAAGVSGVVEKVSIFSTVLRTGDNREIIVPNGQIYGGTIVNGSARDTRRIDLVIGIRVSEEDELVGLIETNLRREAMVEAFNYKVGLYRLAIGGRR